MLSCCSLVNHSVGNVVMRRTLFSRMSQLQQAHQKFDYFLVLDFEATCHELTRISPQEVIEFPCIKVDPRTFDKKSVFHQYVRPVHHPKLTPFCTKLTGIEQETVDDAETFPSVLASFCTWYEEQIARASVNACFVTYGDWDLKTMLPDQCRLSGVDVPPYTSAWCNVKHLVAEVTGSWPRGMDRLMQQLQLPHRGRLHSGIDDCHNIATIVQHMCALGGVVDVTGSRQT